MELSRQRRESDKIKEDREKYASKIEWLKSQGRDGYWEYRTVVVNDEPSGGVNSAALTTLLNNLGLEGWHLVSVYSNDIGVVSRSYGIGGMSSGTNATISQNIMILERYVKI